MPKGSGGGGRPGRSGGGGGDSAIQELNKMAATITNNITSGKMTLSQANAAHETLLSQAKKATGNEKNVLTLKAEVMKAGIDDAKFAMRKKGNRFGYF